jgi:hypothetical protein
MRKFLDIINGQLQTFDATTPKTNVLSRYVDLISEGYSAATVSGLKVEEFIRGYIEAMLATAVDAQGELLKKHYTADDIDHVAMDRIEADCRAFLHRDGVFVSPEHFHGAEISSLEAQAGHDLYMARNGHGQFEQWESTPMLATAMSMGHVEPYVCDGKICLM